MPTPIENPTRTLRAPLYRRIPPMHLCQSQQRRIDSQDYFRTDHLLTNLKGRTIRSGAVTISAQAGKFLLNLTSTMILARLLTPRDSGLVAMVTTVTGFLLVFKPRVFPIATVQRERVRTHPGFESLLDKCHRRLLALLPVWSWSLGAQAVTWSYRRIPPG